MLPAVRVNNVEQLNHFFDEAIENNEVYKNEEIKPNLLLLHGDSLGPLMSMLSNAYETKDGLLEKNKDFRESSVFGCSKEITKYFVNPFWDILAETYDLSSDIETYSMDCPIGLMLAWILSKISQQIGDGINSSLEEFNILGIMGEMDLQGIQYSPADMEILEEVFPQLLISVFEQYKFSELVKITRETICMEDFSEKMTLRKMDCFRKFYHTRADTVIMSLAELKKNYLEQNEVEFDLKSDHLQPDEEVLSWDFANRFLESLDDDERKLLEMRMLSFTLEEIADEFGLETHSAVSKRLHKLEDKFRRYAGKNFYLDSYLKPKYRKKF